ncbi:histone deacetylase [Thermodesulfobacteriota bacterium]
MRRTGFLYDDRYLLHETSSVHPEQSKRLIAIYKGIEDAGILERLCHVEGVRADMQWVEAVHDLAYIRRFGAACRMGHTTFDSMDNQMCADTYDTALYVVGGILRITDLLMGGQIDNGFCAVRPPGHHAEPTRAGGFCYFNNVAIAAKYLQMKWGVRKVGIFDFDVHHGNGTQAIFEQDSTVYYYSIHQHPTFAYPGTGREFERGTGAGHGYTRNYPMLPGQGDKEYFEAIERDFIPTFEVFQPEVIILSTGFDAHAEDDMSDIKVSSAGFLRIIRTVRDLADRLCGGRLVSVLEGGYCLQRLPELAGDHVRTLLED